MENEAIVPKNDRQRRVRKALPENKRAEAWMRKCQRQEHSARSHHKWIEDMSYDNVCE